MLEVLTRELTKRPIQSIAAALLLVFLLAPFGGKLSSEIPSLFEAGWMPYALYAIFAFLGVLVGKLSSVALSYRFVAGALATILGSYVIGLLADQIFIAFGFPSIHAANSGRPSIQLNSMAICLTVYCLTVLFGEKRDDYAEYARDGSIIGHKEGSRIRVLGLVLLGILYSAFFFLGSASGAKLFEIR